MLQLPLGLLGELIDLCLETGQQRITQSCGQVALQAQTLLCLPHAIGREHPCQRVAQHCRQSQLFRQTTSVLTGGAAVGHQNTTAQIDAAVQRHPPHGIGHPLNRELQRPLRQLLC